jgi:hypothetical protein
MAPVVRGVETSEFADASEGANAVAKAEGNTYGHVNAKRSDGATWSKNLACAEARCAETGRSHV